MGFLEGQFPFTNLGVPIVDDRLKIRHLDPLIERGEKKLAGWKNRLLSQRGRLILLRHVLSSMPIHLLSVLHLPKAILRKLNSQFASFFWGKQGGKKKWMWRAWKKL